MRLNWGEAVAACEELAAALARTYRPTHLVALARGGWFPALMLSYRFEEAGIYSILLKYADEARTSLELRSPLPETGSGDRVLLVEDFLVTGRTVGHARTLFAPSGATCRTAALGYLADALVVPDFSLGPKSATPRFPWEA